MSADSYGTKGQPQFGANGAPAIDVDPSAVADYAALVGNHIVGTSAQRNANVVPNSSGKPVWEGLLWDDTTDLIVYRFTGGSWLPLFSQWKAFTPATTGITLGTGGTIVGKYRYDFGHIVQDVLIQLGTAGSAIATLPTVSLAVPAAATPVPLLQYEGVAIYYQNTGGDYNGQVGAPSNDNTKVRLLTWPGAGGLVNAVTAGAPFAWANNDKIWLHFKFPI